MDVWVLKPDKLLSIWPFSWLLVLFLLTTHERQNLAILFILNIFCVFWAFGFLRQHCFRHPKFSIQGIRYLNHHFEILYQAEWKPAQMPQQYYLSNVLMVLNWRLMDNPKIQLPCVLRLGGTLERDQFSSLKAKLLELEN